ncbi:NnrS protein involved in response to NO [Methylophaga frappieri]|uniref:NnrS protein involved in response to NO n=1 Tax=Methylophaga frappieri (strain ATCC BAA-2434 / DSM 25690 / JAM7) TaxID=754477 RepID=I1YEC5_METFJ|nr:NnrS family protein [Methylophaga frappieri]AFJ01268.1 NnrS protein involved in response to NO [Methylophaga frappieri]
MTPELSESEKAIVPLFRQAFRPLFLFGAAFSVIAMLLWGLIISGHINFQFVGNQLFWHSHEMIFGYVAAIVIGFLLTAVQSWTGQRAPHGKTLLVIVMLWLAGRLALLFGAGLPLWLVIAIDLSFLPVSAYLLANPILRAKQTKSLFFIPVLLLLTICNAVMYAGLVMERPDIQQTGSLSAVLLITLLMTVIGGRVIPMFTANGTQTSKVNNIAWLDKTALTSVWLLFALHFLMLTKLIPSNLLSLLFAVSAILVFIRGFRWKIWVTFRVPLLWSLHIGYWFIPLGLIMFSAYYAGLDMPYSVALHALTAGAMGTMILSMMSRVSLGHSGRSLTPKRLISLAFIFIIAVGLIRTLMIWLLPTQISFWLWFSVLAWATAYLLYIILYFPILTTPRPDGKPG